MGEDKDITSELQKQSHDMNAAMVADSLNKGATPLRKPETPTSSPVTEKDTQPYKTELSANALDMNAAKAADELKIGATPLKKPEASVLSPVPAGNDPRNPQ